MPAPLTIILPTHQSAARIVPTLGDLVAGVTDGLVAEVILADSGQDPEIAALAEDVGAQLIVATPGRGTQLAAGAAHARTAWMLFLHDDTRLPPDWARSVSQHIQASSKAGFFKLTFDATGLAPAWVAGWANFRSRRLGLPFGDQGLLIHRELYASIGGYPEIALMEDVVMARRLRGQLMQLPQPVTTSAARYENEGWLRRGARNLSMFTLFLLGVSPDWLAKRYHRRRGSGTG